MPTVPRTRRHVASRSAERNDEPVTRVHLSVVQMARCSAPLHAAICASCRRHSGGTTARPGMLDITRDVAIRGCRQVATRLSAEDSTLHGAEVRESGSACRVTALADGGSRWRTFRWNAAGLLLGALSSRSRRARKVTVPTARGSGLTVLSMRVRVGWRRSCGFAAVDGRFCAPLLA